MTVSAPSQWKSVFNDPPKEGQRIAIAYPEAGYLYAGIVKDGWMVSLYGEKLLTLSDTDTIWIPLPDGFMLEQDD